MSKLIVKTVPCTIKWYNGATNRLRLTEKETELDDAIVALITEQNPDLIETPRATTKLGNKTETKTVVEDDEEQE